MSKLSFTNLRVSVDDNVHHIYKELTNTGSAQIDDIPFTKMPDLFFAAACVGAKLNQYKELVVKRDIFVADALNEYIQIPTLVALAVKKNGYEVIKDPRKILTICEMWANGGIQTIYEEAMIGQGLRPLYRVIDFLLKD
jgi:hypothetical protein